MTVILRSPNVAVCPRPSWPAGGVDRLAVAVVVPVALGAGPLGDVPAVEAGDDAEQAATARSAARPIAAHAMSRIHVFLGASDLRCRA